MKTILDEVRENLKLWSNLQTQFGAYGICRTIEWKYEQERPYKGNILKEKRRAYLLLFYNPEKAAKDQADMNEYLTSLYNDLREGRCRDYCAPDYNKYFRSHRNPQKRAQDQAERRCPAGGKRITAISHCFRMK